jgi:hypothetical protein
MQSDKQAKIRERAHKIWLDEGRVEGKDAEHWHQAEREIEAEDAPAGGKAAKSPAAKSGATKKAETAESKPATPKRKTSSTTSNGTATARSRSRATVGSGAS